ncbi:MAG: ABC transporter ATP-binding protein [Undibacterium sp.]|nr:ABC transporter ATP-binding protein [Opitutaceae bacterium]
MSRPIIEVQGVSKRYELGQVGMTTFRDELQRLLGRAPAGPATREFWALREVNFTVEPGSIVGIIGRNGAGKSTLLKILSRITEPTAGEIHLRGRVASLLEVGTGFHPELTGRENIFLNGTILGMTRAEISRKFDEIVAFAEVDQFIDTPVKRYSSGMYVRLAFAVAAHLEPEILIIDEVLAVGDAAFQRKCLGKMESVSRLDGRTVLFVSHNMAAVSQLTTRAVVLKGGRVQFAGSTSEAIDLYVEEFETHLVRNYVTGPLPRKWPGTGHARIERLSFLKSTPVFQSDADIEFDVELSVARPISKLRISTTVFAADGSAVGGSFGAETDCWGAADSRITWRVRLPNPALAPGRYHLDLAAGHGDFIGDRQEYDVVTDVLYFEVLPPKSPSGVLARWESGWGHIMLPSLQCAPI